jgi:hypothetical protein
VVRINEIDIELVDMHSGFPVAVERSHSKYDADMNSKINSLKEGNIIFSELQSEDVLQTDGIWHFLHIDRFDESLISVVEGATLPEDRGGQIGYNILSRGGANMEYTPEGYDELTVKLLGRQYQEDEWNKIRMDPYREIYSWFTDSPPYEIIHQNIPDEGFILSYHISKSGTHFAENLKNGRQQDD